MEVICVKCGRSFFTWELTVQHTDYPLCTKCETVNDFFGNWFDHLADVDDNVRHLYFEALQEIEDADVSAVL